MAVVVGVAGCVTAPDGSYQPFKLESAIGSAVRNATDSSWAPLTALGEIQTALVYARVGKTPIPYGELAFAYDDVVAASDEFQRRDRIKAARERIDRANAQLEGVTSFVVRTEVVLEKYDFEKGGFTTGLESLSFRPFLNNIQHMVKAEPYQVSMLNGQAFAFVPVPEEKAQKALKSVGGGRKAMIELEVEPVLADTVATMHSPKTRVLVVKVVRMRVSAGRDVIGEVGTAKAPPRAEATEAN